MFHIQPRRRFKALCQRIKGCVNIAPSDPLGSYNIDGVRLTQSLMVILSFGYTFFIEETQTCCRHSHAMADVSSSGLPPSADRIVAPYATPMATSTIPTHQKAWKGSEQ